MGTTFVVYIGIYKLLTLIAAIIAGAWYLSSRLTRVETKVEGFDTRLTNFESRQPGLTQTASPISLTTKGKEILTSSGLQKYIDDNFQHMFSGCGGSKMGSPYDVQVQAFAFLDKYIFPEEMERKLKDAAFNAGVTTEVIRRLGGIHLRDKCLGELKMDVKELDQMGPDIKVIQ
jgi:hypothetical protein